MQSYAERAAEMEIVNRYRPERESPLNITLAQAIGKGDKMDWVVEKVTELGVRSIDLFFILYCSQAR
ncbi:MAG: 16S rRNA (uracil(1498)-N(3))-methyltransferase [Deltaproteobacteria bacterium]|nr:16S rRNA (uracil(1498)-N(3))-methyltransferase [Deltaproteobacteria bacterium]